MGHAASSLDVAHGLIKPHNSLMTNSANAAAGGYVPTPPGPDDDRFARSFKNWREWRNAVDFINNLQFEFDESEVLSLAVDPPDVVFRDARFEVKEIMDPGRRRHDEAKEGRAYAKANGGQARLVQYTPKDLTPQRIGHLVTQALDELATKDRYTYEQRSGIDLLFYVNKLEFWFESGDMPDSIAFEPYGWRSVSAIFATQQSMTFHARRGAPDFLIQNVGLARDRTKSHPSLTPSEGTRSNVLRRSP